MSNCLRCQCVRGVKLSWCQIVRQNDLCQIFRCQIVRCAKLSANMAGVKLFGVIVRGVKLSGVKLSWCLIVRCQIARSIKLSANMASVKLSAVSNVNVNLFPKKVQHILLKRGLGGQWMFGESPKIHLFWWGGASLRQIRLHSTRYITGYLCFDLQKNQCTMAHIMAHSMG